MKLLIAWADIHVVLCVVMEFLLAKEPLSHCKASLRTRDVSFNTDSFTSSDILALVIAAVSDSPSLCFQPPARTYAVQIAVNVKLKQISRVITRSAGLVGLNSKKAGSLHIELADKSVDEAYRVVRTNVIIDRVR